MRRLAPVALLLVLWVPAAGAWTWPVNGPVLQGFSFDPAQPYADGQHRGVDVGADAFGEAVVAPISGVVSFAGTVPSSGKSLTIDTPDGLAVTLTHLGSISVAKGDAVAEGADVATVGPSGTPEVDGPYVHIGIRTADDPQGYLDPLTFLPAAVAPAPVEAPASSPAPAAAPAPPAQADPPAAGAPVEEAPPGPAPEPAAPAADPTVDSAPDTGAPPVQPPVAQPEPATPEPTEPAAPPAPAPAVADAAPASAPAPAAPAAGEAPPALEPPLVLPAAAPPVQTPVAGAVTAAAPPVAAPATVLEAPPSVSPSAATAAVPAPRATHVALSSGRREVRTAKPVLRPLPASLPARPHALPARTPRRPVPQAAVHARRHRHVPVLPLGLLALAAGAAIGAARMISSRSPSLEGTNADPFPAEDPRRSRLAVRERSAASGPRRRPGRALGYLRALPPVEGQRRADGERHGRARDTGDGGRRSRGRLAA